jgi:hypothetical protein
MEACRCRSELVTSGHNRSIGLNPQTLEAIEASQRSFGPLAPVVWLCLPEAAFSLLAALSPTQYIRVLFVFQPTLKALLFSGERYLGWCLN